MYFYKHKPLSIHMAPIADCCRARATAGEVKPELGRNASSVVNSGLKYIFDWLQWFLARPSFVLGDSTLGFINETLVAGQKHIPSACWSSWLK